MALDKRQFGVIARAWFAERDRTGITPKLPLMQIGRQECQFSNGEIKGVIERVRFSLNYKPSTHVTRCTVGRTDHKKAA